MENKSCSHMVTKGKEGEHGSWCIECGEKILEVESEPCKNCKNITSLPFNKYACKKLLMAVFPTMHAGYYIKNGTCFEPNKI